MNHPIPNVRLERHVDISAYGCEVMTVGDINGDGRLELVFMQNVGMLTLDCFRPGSDSNYGKLYTTPEDQALDCVTAIDLEGRVIWQRGEPWRLPIPFRTHGGMDMIRTDDINGDGKQELLRIKGDVLESLDGSTGRTLHQASLGEHGYSSIYTAHLDRGSAARHVFVKPCSDGMPGHPYGCPVLMLDHQLKRVWGPVDFHRVGHTPLAFDVDGDGRDELLIGAECVDGDGAVRWRLPVERDHDDRRYIHDIDDDGEPEQILAFESSGLVVSDLRGKIKFVCESDHCGEAVVGKFYSDRPGMQILFNNEAWRLKSSKHAFGSMMVDCRGKEIWRTEHDLYGRPIDWPTSVGPQAILAKPHAAAPPDGRPFIMDGSGATIARFDIPLQAPTVDRERMPQSNVAFGDWGDYYSHRAIVVPGVGPRVLIWTRRDLWIFKAEV